MKVRFDFINQRKVLAMNIYNKDMQRQEKPVKYAYICKVNDSDKSLQDVGVNSKWEPLKNMPCN